MWLSCDNHIDNANTIQKTRKRFVLKWTSEAERADPSALPPSEGDYEGGRISNRSKNLLKDLLVSLNSSMLGRSYLMVLLYLSLSSTTSCVRKPTFIFLIKSFLINQISPLHFFLVWFCFFPSKLTFHHSKGHLLQFQHREKYGA